jgi:hypothetical protein
MDEALPVGLAKCYRQTNGDAHEANQIERVSSVLLDYPIQRFTAWILETQGNAPFMTCQRERLSCPRRIEFSRERPFVFEPPDPLERWLFTGDRERQDRHRVAEFSTAVKSETRLLAKRLQHVSGILCH